MKPKIGDAVQFKKSGITGTVEKIIRGTCVVKTPTSRLSAWPEDLIIVGLSKVSLDKEMEEHQKLCDEIMTIQGIEPIEAEMEQIIHCPDGYVFKDENGNVINATKIVLEKKKKEYPKTYEESVDVLGGVAIVDIITYYYSKQLIALYKLLICRDAYWKIAGDEMGLGEPWKPDWNHNTEKYVIYPYQYLYSIDVENYRNTILAFPTEEMRDAFYENFKVEIESCKELL